MANTLDNNSSVPLYQQLFLEIQKKIDSGELSPGAKIPSEAQLSEEEMRDYGYEEILFEEND